MRLVSNYKVTKEKKIKGFVFASWPGKYNYPPHVMKLLFSEITARQY